MNRWKYRVKSWCGDWRKKNCFLGGIKMFSVQMIKELYCHATKLVPCSHHNVHIGSIAWEGHLQKYVVQENTNMIMLCHIATFSLVSSSPPNSARLNHFPLGRCFQIISISHNLLLFGWGFFMKHETREKLHKFPQRAQLPGGLSVDTLGLILRGGCLSGLRWRCRTTSELTVLSDKKRDFRTRLRWLRWASGEHIQQLHLDTGQDSPVTQIK